MDKVKLATFRKWFHTTPMNNNNIDNSIATAAAHLETIHAYLSNALHEMENHPEAFELSDWLTPQQITTITQLESIALNVLLDHLGALE